MFSSPDKIEQIFSAALQLASEDERKAYLDRACEADQELRRLVEKLLRAHPKAAQFLEQPFVERQATADDSIRERLGTVIGPYKLLQEVGEGGMGTVYMAQQTEPVKRLVALKVIKPGMDSRQVIARFEAERQALALMDHPNIARVLDAGSTESGRPFFVMELVKGTPITQYCDERRLTPRQRLELFIPVCQAIQHAHQKGVIHRDIKPSNVLVAMYDDRAVPKVIDFGVAKATGQQLTERTLVTGLGAVVGTLEYMSPEQAELNQLDIDTRSDIYSLGVLLYELLTGSTPLEKNRLKAAALLEVLRVIREEEPPKPSTRLSTTDEMPSVAANRGLEPKKLSWLVRGELDWIVMKALDKDRNRRYETANGFAMDIQRYLGGEPVLAAPPSARYRLGKFARKHRAALTTVVAVGLLLVAGTAFSVWQAARATRAEKEMGAALTETKQAKAQLESALQDSEESRRQAEAVTKFLVELFRSSDPREDGRVIRLVDLLDRAAAELDANFADSPKTKADLVATLGETYQGLRLYRKAGDMFEKERALRQATLGPDHPKTLDAIRNIAWAYRGDGRPNEAIALAEELLRLQTAKLGVGHRVTLETASILGDAYRTAERPAEAIRLLEPSLELCKTKLGASDDVTLDTMNNLALAYQFAGRLPEGVSLLKQTLDLMTAKLGPDNHETVNTTNNLAGAYLAVGRPGQVVSLLEESLPRCKTKFGRVHPITLTGMYELAVAYEATDQPAKARQLFAESAESMRDQLGPSDQRGPGFLKLAGALAWLGRNQLLQQKYTEAELTLRECLAIREKTQPGEWTTFNTKSMLGGALLGQKKYAEAEPLLLGGYEGMKQREAKIPPEGKVRLTEALERLAQLDEAMEKKDEAARWRKELEARKESQERLKLVNPRPPTSPGTPGK